MKICKSNKKLVNETAIATAEQADASLDTLTEDPETTEAGQKIIDSNTTEVIEVQDEGKDGENRKSKNA